jgi:16S rRNA (guanine966-N2)-methyltransferase
MRIIAGRFRGAKLDLPPLTLARPTKDFVKERLFSILESLLKKEGRSFMGTSVLDGFAGSGSLGLEAWSRGAKTVFFVEHHPQVLTTLRRNLTNLHAQEDCPVLEHPLTHLGAAPQPMDLIFLDPPYGQGLIEPTLGVLYQKGWIGPQTFISLELGAADALVLPSWADLATDRRSGVTRLMILTLSTALKKAEE